MDKTAKLSGMVVLVVGVLVVLYGMQAGWFPKLGAVSGTTPQTGDTVIPAGGCNVIPTYSYSAVNNFAKGTSVGGTNYIKINGNAPVTSLANPTFGDTLTYWKSNNTGADAYYCAPTAASTVKCGSQSIQQNCYRNATSSTLIKVFDADNNRYLTADSGATNYNLTMGANNNYNLEVQYKADQLKSAMPFGGCIAVELSSNVTSVTMAGQGITSSCPYVFTYSPSSTSNTVWKFGVPTGFDADGVGDTKKIEMTVKTGTGNPAPITGKVVFQPALYYAANDGSFALGIEKDKNNGDNTKLANARTFNVYVK